MYLKHQQLYPLVVFLPIILCFYCRTTLADGMMTTNDRADSNAIYDNLLQREYAGPLLFPNHVVVERKAPRSPSLRLRFGRRSDPDMMLTPSAEKRWFGDVNQKPIRSPSLRLRFGRRNDPTMPLHNAFDEMLNDVDAATETDADLDAVANAYDDAVASLRNVRRKPERLRFGRSIPFAGAEMYLNDREVGDDLFNNNDEDEINPFIYTVLTHLQTARNFYPTLRKFENDYMRSMFSLSDDSSNPNAVDNGDNFEREIRKTGPLRLRWGRSTGGQSNNKAIEVADLQQQGQQQQQQQQHQQKRDHLGPLHSSLDIRFLRLSMKEMKIKRQRITSAC